MWWLVLISIFAVSALNWGLVYRWKYSFKDAVLLTATLVSIASTVTLGFFAWQSQQRTFHLEQFEKRSQWTDLRNTIWDIIDQFPQPGCESMRQLPLEKRIEWMNRVRRLLDVQGSNQVLMENEESLAHWRSAVATTRMISNFLLRQGDYKGLDDLSVRATESILKDVMFVWDKLVLQSHEISPTGGLPQKFSK